MSREGRRRFWMGMMTLAGIAKRGFFIPYRYAGGVPGPGLRPPYAAIEQMFAGRAQAFGELLARSEAYAGDLAAFRETSPPEPRWLQSWFPRLDAAIAYVLVRERRPHRILEVGSGHSTRFLSRAARDGGLATRITAVDPAPRADIGRLDVALVGATAQEAEPRLFGALEEGDVLFIDSSHILMPGTDVDYLLNVVLPQLPAGVLVHIHDVFLPDDYPAAWEWRGYNEQQGVAALLQGGGFELLWGSRYVATRMADRVARSALGGLPVRPDVYETSLWLRKVQRTAGHRQAANQP
jgi:predicted O-methyltransferase YrrM